MRNTAQDLTSNHSQFYYDDFDPMASSSRAGTSKRQRENLEEIDYVDDDDYFEEDRLKQSNQSNKFFDEIKDDEHSNKVSPYSGKRHTYDPNENELLDSAPKNAIKSTNRQSEGFSAEKYSPIRVVENDLALMTKEKIANLKEFSKDMFSMEENERKSPGINIQGYSDATNKSTSKLPPRKSEEQESSAVNQSKSAKAVKKPEINSGPSSYKKKGIPKLYDGIKPFEDRFLSKNVEEQAKITEISDSYRSSEVPRNKFTFEKDDLKKEIKEPSLVPNLNVSFTLGKNPKIPMQNYGISPDKEDRQYLSQGSSPDKALENPTSDMNSPGLLAEVKNSTSQCTPRDAEFEDIYHEKSDESRMKHLIESKMLLTEKLAKQEQSLLKYKDALKTIENQQKEISQLESKMMQNEISYKTQISILKDNHKRFIPNLATPDYQGAMQEKDRVIKELNGIIMNITRDKERLEEQVRDKSRRTQREKHDALALSKFYTEDDTKFGNDNLETAAEMSKFELPSTIRQGDLSNVNKVLDCFSSERAYLLLGIHVHLKNLLRNILERREHKVSESIDEIIELVEKYLQKETHLTEKGSDILDQTLKVCVEISQAVHVYDWNTSESMVRNLEKTIMGEFTKIDMLQKIVTATKAAPQEKRETARSIPNKMSESRMGQSFDIKAKPVKVTEIYASDYSDEEFGAEDVEEKQAVELVYNLKETLQENNIDDQKIKTIWYNIYEEFLPEKAMVPSAQVCNFFCELGIERDIYKYQALFLRLDCFDVKAGTVDLIKLVNTVRAKDNLWWKTKIHNNSFDLKYKSMNLAHILQPDNSLRLLIFENIGTKFANHMQTFDIGRTLQNKQKPFQGGFMVKRDLRKWFIANKFPFTKLETQIISFLLDIGGKNKIYQEDLDLFLKNGQLVPFHNQYLERQKISADPNACNQDAFDEIISSLRKQLQTMDELSRKQIKDIFQLRDTRFSGVMNYQQFYECCNESNLPFTSAEEIDIVFYHLADEYKNRSTINLMNKVVPYSKFLDLIFSEQANLTQSQNARQVIGIKERDLKYQLITMENELKEAQSKIQELEGKLKAPGNGASRSIQGSPISYNKENQQSISNSSSFYRKGSAKLNITSTERTLKMKVEDLEYENAKLRKTLQEQTTKLEDDKQRMSDRRTVEHTHEENLGDESVRTVKKLEKKLDNMEKNYMLKEVELKSELNRMNQMKSAEMEIMRKHFEAERQNYQKMLDSKNREIDNFRTELEGVLTEMDTLRRRTDRTHRTGF